MICTPSNDRIWTSVFCHNTGIASHTADVLLGTSHVTKFRYAGKLKETLGVGFDASQTFVNVCPANKAVLHPWPVRLVEPLTQLQSLKKLSSRRVVAGGKTYDGQHITAVV